MAENRGLCLGCNSSAGKETISVEVNRILDSCRDRDCYEDIKVHLTDFGQEIIERTGVVRVKHACIVWTHITLDPVQFNRGFYQVSIRFYVRLFCEACVSPGRVQDFEGIVVIEKKVILFGSESSVNIFRSNPEYNEFCAVPDINNCTRNSPVATVEVVDPVVLSAKVVEKCNCRNNCCCCACDIPEHVAGMLSGSLNDRDSDKSLVVSLGFFSIIRIIRPGQYLINATEHCIPEKECISAEEENPCNLFKSISFPVNEFCPPSFASVNDRAAGNDRR